MENRKRIMAKENHEKKKIALLFICLGNICRSPAAHAIMQRDVDEAGLSDRFFIDSAGIGPWHVGDLPDRRMRQHGAQRGLDISHIARQFNAKSDFRTFDRIVVMDEDNYRAVASKAMSEADRRKIIRMSDYLLDHPGAHSVPDPYYGDCSDFELALDLIEDGCRHLLAAIINKEEKRIKKEDGLAVD